MGRHICKQTSFRMINTRMRVSTGRTGTLEKALPVLLGGRQVREGCTKEMTLESWRMNRNSPNEQQKQESPSPQVWEQGRPGSCNCFMWLEQGGECRKGERGKRPLHKGPWRLCTGGAWGSIAQTGVLHQDYVWGLWKCRFLSLTLCPHPQIFFTIIVSSSP